MFPKVSDTNGSYSIIGYSPTTDAISFSLTSEQVYEGRYNGRDERMNLRYNRNREYVA
jgi:hypothetical protein